MKIYKVKFLVRFQISSSFLLDFLRKKRLGISSISSSLSNFIKCDSNKTLLSGFIYMKKRFP